MPFFGFTIDTWALKTYERTMIATVSIQSTCLFITLILSITRIYRIYLNWNQLKLSYKFALLHGVQLLMMIFSILYIFFHGWNYIHLFLASNPMDCDLWMRSLIICFVMTRILMIVFLMVRSTVSFAGTFCELSLKITLPIIAMSVCAGVVLAVEIFTQIQTFYLIPNKFCWRIVTKTGNIMGAVSHGANCVLSMAVLIVFYVKSRAVRKEMKVLQNNNELNVHYRELEREFNKHIQLGALTVFGTIIMFFFSDFLSILLGITFALDQVVNNVLTFIMFKEHTNVYKCLCCGCGHDSTSHHEGNRVQNILSFETTELENTVKTVTIPTTDTLTSTAEPMVLNSHTLPYELETTTEITAFKHHQDK
eukprot:191655_1